MPADSKPNAPNHSSELIASLERRVAENPGDAAALSDLGRALRHAGRLSAAIAAYERSLQLDATVAMTHVRIGVALRGAGRVDEAIRAYERAIGLEPELAAAHGNLGVALKSKGRLSEAIESLQCALRLDPNSPPTYNNLGITLAESGHLDQAIEAYKKAVELSPGFAAALANRGNALRDQGQLIEAMTSYQLALDQDPRLTGVHSNLLATQHYEPGIRLADLAASHSAWNDQHAAGLRDKSPSPDSVQRDDPKLRIGFVSADFMKHPVGYFFVRFLESLPPHLCNSFCYADRVRHDDLTDRIERCTGTWRDVTHLADEQLAEQIRQDGIDVLFDLAGHSRGNRLLVFARRPAPVQVTWIGYIGTTGLDAIDYLVADEHHIPLGAEEFYSENIIRLPETRFCYDPPSDAPPVGALPAGSTGRVTFGCFNNPAKVNPAVVAVWCSLLKQVPDARLVLKYRGLNTGSTAKRFLQLFADRGIGQERIQLRGWTSHDEMLGEYNEIDIALDPFPFSGATTTCEALWMGVPVVTLPGETFASRQSLSILANVGETAMVTHDAADYVRVAAELARDRTRLADLRARLRGQVMNSSLCDADRFTRHMWSAIQKMAAGAP